MDDDGRTGVVLSIIRTVAETGSTNADLLELARGGAEDGLWLRAVRQTAGRGRLGREWSSPEGNLYASTLVRLRPSDPPAASLALVAAVALQETVSTFLVAGICQGTTDASATLVLKWPNDLLLADAKLSGILLERTGDAVIVGYGVNIAHHPDLPDRVTTDLAGDVPRHSRRQLHSLGRPLADRRHCAGSRSLGRLCTPRWYRADGKIARW
jgi:BirA family biotin operon repressor/biotin-[acetyl-CoA-carboxylase] ligase